MQKSDVFQDRKCIYPNKWIFFIKPPRGSECKLYMSFSKLRELCYFIFFFFLITGLQVHIDKVSQQMDEG